MSKLCNTVVVSLICLGLLCSAQGASGDGDTLENMIKLYSVDRNALLSFYSIQQSEWQRDRIAKFYDESLANLQAVNFDSLDRDSQVDYILLRNEIEREITRLQRDRLYAKEMAGLLPFADKIISLEEARWRLEDVDARKAGEMVSEITESIKDIRKLIKEEQDKQKAEVKQKKQIDSETDNSNDKDAALAEKYAQNVHGNEDLKQAADKDDNKDTKVDEKETVADSDSDTDPDAVAANDAVDVEHLNIEQEVAKRASHAVRSLHRALRSWYDFHSDYRPDFTWWVEKPFAEADKALDSYANYLRDTVAGVDNSENAPLQGQPIGHDALVEELHYEMIAYSPEEVIKIGEMQFKWCEEQMIKAAAELGYDDWHDALEYVKSQYVAPGEQDDLVAQQAKYAIQFVDDHELVTVPDLCRETWRLRMITEQGQKNLPFAAYGGQVMLVAYPTQGMDHEKKMMSMRGNNIHFSRIVTPHELIPGHHLQGFMADRFKTYRQLFGTPFYVEGWSLHWELLLWDENYPQTPEDKIGMLFWRMHRAARIIVSLKFHLNEMQPDEMVDFLVERVGHEREGATSEVRRFIGGGYGPLYQCAYMIGGMQLHALQAEMVETGKMSYREFHDEILKQNAIPIEMVRAAINKDIPLSADWSATWKFAGDISQQ